MHALELPLIRAVQRIEGLGRIMSWISDFGPGKPMLIVIGLAFFLFDVRFAFRLAVVTLVCLSLRELLAMLLQSPRPYWFGEGVKTFKDPPLSTPTFGFPSGHAMASATFWFFVAGEVGRRWMWGLAASIVLAVCVSRVYLGVHFPSDVILGVLLGSLFLVAFRRWEGRVERHWVGLTRERRIVWALGFGLGLGALTLAAWVGVSAAVPPGAWHPYGITARSGEGLAWSAGSLCGVALAWVAPEVWTGARDPWSVRSKRLAVIAIPAAIYLLLPKEWRAGLSLPGDSEWLKLSLRFGTGAFLAWAGLSLMPRALARIGRVDRKAM